MTPTWVAIAALVISAATFVYNWLTKRKDRREQADRDKAAEALRSDEQRKLEARVEQEQQGLREQVDSLRQLVEEFRDMNAATREAATVPDIAWKLTQVGKNAVNLRNKGKITAHRVEIDEERAKVARIDVEGENDGDVNIEPDGSVKIMWTPGFGARAPGELWVRCMEEPEWRAVPLET